MKIRNSFVYFMLVLFAISLAGYAASLPNQQIAKTAKPRRKAAADSIRNAQNKKGKELEIKAQPIMADDNDSIPDSLLNTRWKVQPTVPVTQEDLDRNGMDLKRPDNLKGDVTYNDTINRYIFGSKIGGTYIAAPLMMTPEEYMKWSSQQSFRDFYRKKNDEIYKAKGKDKFDFSDMHFDLGPAEKIFGPGGVRIKTQGTAELKLGATMKNIDNPSLPIRNRKTTQMSFDEKINLTMNGKVGDKVNLNLNYNTESTFDFDSQNLKLKYDGKEDEIVKLVEAGNISFPANSSLIRGASSLFGLRTDLQFGKLKLEMVASQKKSSSKSVSSTGGVQLTPYEIDVADYEENRHFFLSHFFRDKYDAGMSQLPNIMTGIKINRVEVWVTNKTGTTSNTRNIIALTDLGENAVISNNIWNAGGQNVPSNTANDEYSSMVNNYSGARDINGATTVLDAIPGFQGGKDYEKLESARLLSSSEYTVNTSLGYISLRTASQTDQVLAVAYEYTYGGITYQVGEFSGDITDASKALFVKSLKNTSNNPTQGNWDLMMKNVYYLASSVEKDKFRLDVKFQSDTTGVYISYIPEPEVKSQPIIRDLGADRLDNNNRPNPNGYFDYVNGYTINNGRVFFPKAEPFGSYLYDYLKSKGVSDEKAAKYAFTELYDSTKTIAKQIAEKDKYIITGQFRGTTAGIISLGAINVPQGSVVVTAGGVTLTEGSDYVVDYNAGEVTILNQSILDAGTSVNVSLESNSDYAQQRKTLFGMNWYYDFSKNLQMSGTIQHLTEQSLTKKVSMGSEPLNNTLWGVNINWKKESQWLTNMLDKIPLLHLTQPSNISFTGEFAQLIAGQSSRTQDNASYLDDFENTKNTIDISNPTQWMLSSVPSMFPNHDDKTSLKSGYARSQMAWYNIDPLFTRRSSSLTPSHIKSDLEQLSNHYVREVYVRELFPKRNQSNYNGATSTLPILNIAYYPNERGPYNFNPSLNFDGTVMNPENNWGGMMRRLDTNDFETANVEYIEFWMLDPFIYTRREGKADDYSGDFYINLGEVSEDILCDGRKFYESGMPVDGSNTFTTTQWGKIPTQTTVTYAFATSSGSRALQDVGFNGLNDKEEQEFPSYQDFLTAIQGKVSAAVFDSIFNDPAADDYHYFRGSDYDRIEAPILRRYKYINNPQGNSPDTSQRTESYDTSYKSGPDAEDINQDYTLNEYEKYFQYKVSIRPEDLVVGKNYIVDKRETSWTLRNGKNEEVTWYQFRIPLDEYEKRYGSISDFTSIRFMRMFLTGFKHPIVLRFGSFDLVRGEWRIYEQNLDNVAGSGTMAVSAVSIEENSDKTPVNYVLPPGISRESDPTQPQLVESNEQALDITVNNLSHGESKAVYKNSTVDMRQYKHLQMFVHANAFEQNTTNLADGQLALFIRLGSDYKNNYYEYEIPLKLTPAGRYALNSTSARKEVWPLENMLDVDLSLFTDLKKERNKAKGQGLAAYNIVYYRYDDDNPSNKISIMGNPSLGEVKTMMIGVRNLSNDVKSGDIWVNELRLKEYNNEGGWAANGNLNVQLSDLGSVNVQGKYISDGFGGIEENITQRSMDDYKNYSVTASVELGKFFPDKAKVSAPLYYSISKEETSPRYNPLDTDMKLSDALDATTNQHERDSIESIAVRKVTSSNFSLSNLRWGLQTKKHPMPYDPANLSFSYSHSHREVTGETTVYEREDNWRGALDYTWSPVYKTFEPFSKIKSKSKWFDILKKFGLNYLPQNISANSEITRNYYELQERDMEDLNMQTSLPLTFSEQFLWNREFSMRWDITKNLHMNFQSATHAEIEEPYTPVNKELYPDAYAAWKDSVKTSLRHFGAPLDYNQNFTMSYQLPLNLIPVFDWINADASYSATYNWIRGSELEDGTNLGNTITNNRNMNLNSTINMERLYNHIPFLKKANERANKLANKARLESSRNKTNKNNSKGKKSTADNGKGDKSKETAANVDKTGQKNEKGNNVAKTLPKNKNSFEKELTLTPDTTITVKHNRKTKRIIVSARTTDGHPFKLKYKKAGDDAIKIISQSDSATKIKLTVTAKEPLDDKTWYKAALDVSRFLMMVRQINISYRNQYSMSLPGFKPTIGDAFGQKGGSVMSPGLDFAFGLTGDDYIEKARENDWLLINDSIATPAATNKTEDLQLKITLEPFKNFKIDLNATRTQTTAKSVQYMYAGNPTTQSGIFTMTTISIGSAFEGMGNATSGYHSATFEKFCNALPAFRDRVEAQYANITYPDGTTLAGKPFDAANGGVNMYSADVMVPAFLSTYTSSGKGKLDIFPALTRILPNWTFRYSGLGNLPWFRDVFKSVNLNHSYKSIYSVGSYASYSTFQEVMNGLGFISDATTGNPIPNSMFNVSTVSINESFSPLLGIDMTFDNDLTAKLEYRTQRSINLSMTSIQINEALSHDWVIGLGYRLNNFNPFSPKAKRVKSNAKNTKGAQNTDKDATKNTKRNSSSGFNNSLNLRFDLSFRKQAAITRDIATLSSAASSGNSALKISFTADYSLSKMLSLSFYFDRQTNTPLLASSSYPTTTQDFGLNLKFSLTR